MELSEQCVSLELAKRLKELGVKESSLFYWIGKKNVDIAVFGIMFIHEFANLEDGTLDQYEFYSAFTVAELGEMLPDSAASGKDILGGWFCRAVPKDDWIVFDKDTEANCRAKMLVHLVEKKLHEPS